MGWRFTVVAALIVRPVPPKLTTPVTSSMRSSWPAARLEFVRGRVNALTELVLPGFTVREPPVTEITFAKLTSMPSPPWAPMVCEVVAVDVKGPENEATQTAPDRHG